MIGLSPCKLLMNEAWEKLVATALVGTDRQTPNFSGFDGDLGALVEQLSGVDSEGQVLGVAGAISTYIRAGTQATEYQGTVPEVCGGDDLPRCSDLTNIHVQQVLSGPYRRMLPEVLSNLQAAKQRVPEDCLPTLLDLGRQQSHLRAAIQQVVGKRGRWLAQFNPDWRYVSEDISPANEEQDILLDRWETGTPATRLAVLQSLRETSPDKALALLQTTWKQEKAKDRAGFLQQFETGLSPADEPFLESCLDDRSKEVRGTAADLLTQSPDSQLCQRMTERIQTLIQIHSSPDGLTLVVTLPEKTERAWERDGLVDAKRYRLGQRASLLMQILSAVPLAVWDKQAPIEQLLQAAEQHKWRAAMLKGWEIAAQRQQNVQWSQALISQLIGQTDTAETLSLDLFAVLAERERERLMTQWLSQLWSSGKREVWRTVVAAIAQSDQIPTLAFSHLLLRGLQSDLTEVESFAKANDYPYQLRSYVDSLAYFLDPQVVNQAGNLAAAIDRPDLHPRRREMISEWLEIMNFRFAVKQEFATIHS